ncbi:hypothetical protein [Leadbettera azotonutricia]|nr:hypothetical protein [Leadbettera azotonutricia]
MIFLTVMVMLLSFTACSGGGQGQSAQLDSKPNTAGISVDGDGNLVISAPLYEAVADSKATIKVPGRTKDTPEIINYNFNTKPVKVGYIQDGVLTVTIPPSALELYRSSDTETATKESDPNVLSGNIRLETRKDETIALCLRFTDIGIGYPYSDYFDIAYSDGDVTFKDSYQDVDYPEKSWRVNYSLKKGWNIISILETNNVINVSNKNISPEAKWIIYSK